jgi:hypothetical protein
VAVSRHPGEQGSEERGHYFKLPYAYWLGNFQNRIGLTAEGCTAHRVVAPRDFLLPAVRGQQWYGLSRDTVREGLRGYTYERRYTLQDRSRVTSVC